MLATVPCTLTPGGRLDTGSQDDRFSSSVCSRAGYEMWPFRFRGKINVDFMLSVGRFPSCSACVSSRMEKHLVSCLRWQRNGIRASRGAVFTFERVSDAARHVGHV